MSRARRCASLRGPTVGCLAGHGPVEVDVLEAHGLQAAHEAPGAQGLPRGLVDGARDEGLLDLVEHRARGRAVRGIRDSGGLLQQPRDELAPLGPDLRERPAVARGLGVAQVGAEVEQLVDGVGVLAHQPVHDPRGGRGPAELADALPEHPVIGLGVLRALVACRRELLGHEGVELVGCCGERVGRHGLHHGPRASGREGHGRSGREATPGQAEKYRTARIAP